MVTYRTNGAWGTGKGANLTAPEVDGNFWELVQRVNEAASAGVGIASATVNGSQLTLHLTDGTSLAPVTLPKAIIRFRGNWIPGVAYSELDVVSAPNNAGIYLVARAHTSASTFDRNATNADGNLYQWLFPTQASTLAALSDVSATAPADGNALVWDATAGTWAPGEVASSGGGTATVFTETTNFTYNLTSPGSFVDYNGTVEGYFTIPTNANVAIPVGSVIRGGVLNTGTLIIYGEAGVTLNGVLDGWVSLPASQSEYVLRKRATDDWRISVITTAV